MKSTTQTLGQVAFPVNNNVLRVRHGAIAKELDSKHASPAERRLVEFLAETAGVERRQLSQEKVLRGARIHYESLKRAVPRAIRDGFIGRDTSTRPFTYWIDEQWLA